MALEINRQHTALLAMDYENDVVHPDGAFKDFGFAKMVADNNVLDKSAQLLAAARGAGITVIYISVKFRPGYPERPANSGIFQAIHGGSALVEGTWGSEIHEKVTRLNMIAAGTIDEKIAEALENKQKISDLILDWKL